MTSSSLYGLVKTAQTRIPRAARAAFVSYLIFGTRPPIHDLALISDVEQGHSPWYSTDHPEHRKCQEEIAFWCEQASHEDHRFLTPTRWDGVKDLAPGYGEYLLELAMSV